MVLAALAVALLPATAQAHPADAGRRAALQPVFVVPVAGQDAGARAATATAIVRAASGAQSLHDGGTDGSGVGIALVDSGVMTLPGLDAGQVVKGPDFSADARDSRLKGRDAFGHGNRVGAGASEWNGRRWSGRRWSGRRWSGGEWVLDKSGKR